MKKIAIHSLFWSAIRSWGNQAGGLVIFFVLARLLEPKDFGLVGLATVFQAFVQVFLDQGFTAALIQRQTIEEEHLNTAFWTNISIGALLSLIGFASADFIAVGFKQVELIPILRAFSILFLINSFTGVQEALLTREFAFRALATRSLIGTFSGGVVGISMAFMGFGIWSIVFQRLVREIAIALVLWKASQWRPKLSFSKTHFSELFRFGINILGLNLLNFINTRSDDFLIGYFLGPIELGYYTVAYRILRIMIELLIQTGSDVLLPTFSKLQKTPEKLREAYYTATRLTSVIAFPMFLGLAILSPEVVTVLFGEKWLPSAPVMTILSFAGLLTSVSYFSSPVFLAMGKPDWKLKINLLSSISNLILFALVVRSGILAVALAFTVRGYVFFPIGQWAIAKLIHVETFKYLRQFLGSLLATSVTVAAIAFARPLLFTWTTSSAVVLMVCIAIGGVLYVLTLYSFAPSIVNEIINMFALLKAKKASKET